MKIAYVVGSFPTLTERFLLREFGGMRRLMVDFHIYALHRPGREGAATDVDEEILSRTSYFPSLCSPSLWWRCLTTLVRQPRRCLSELWFLLSPSLLSPSLLSPSPLTLLRWHLRHFPNSLWLADELRRGGFTHIHAHFAHVTSSVGMVAAAIVELPFTFTAHAYDVYVEPILLREKIQRAQAVMTCTQANKEYLLSLFPNTSPEKIHVIYHGLLPEELPSIPPTHPCFHPSLTSKVLATPSFRHPDRPFAILFVGRLVPKKGVDVLLRAVAKLRQWQLPVRCLVIGDGPQRQCLERLSVQLRLNNFVIFLGSLPFHEVQEHYRQANALVVPSVVDARGDRDGLPNVLLEAAAFGVPIVASRLSAIPEFVEHEKTGLLAESGNDEELANALKRMYYNPQLRANLAAQARQRVVEQFQAVENARKLREVWVKVKG